MSELPYRKMPGLNQSLLKKGLIGPALINEQEEEEERKHFVLGQYVEDLLFSADISRYITFTFPSKTTNVGKLCWAIYQYFLSHERWPTSNEANILYTDLGIKRPAFVDLLSECETILRPLKNVLTIDSHIVSEDIVEQAKIACKKVKEDVLTSKALSTTDSTQSFIKVPLTWLHDDEEQTLCKGELDLVRVNHEKRVIRIIDIKTIGDIVYLFDKNFWKYRYDFQLSFYNFGLSRSKWYKDNFDGYTILPPMILAVDFKTPAPLFFQLKKETLELGENGGMTDRGYEVKGWREAIELYKFYNKHGYRYPKEVILKKYIEI